MFGKETGSVSKLDDECFFLKEGIVPMERRP